MVVVETVETELLLQQVVVLVVVVDLEMERQQMVVLELVLESHCSDMRVEKYRLEFMVVVAVAVLESLVQIG